MSQGELITGTGMRFSPVLCECAGLTDRLFDKIISNLEQNLLDVLVQLFRGVNLPHQLSQPNQRESNIYHWLNFWVPCLVPINQLLISCQCTQTMLCKGREKRGFFSRAQLGPESKGSEVSGFLYL